MFKKNILMGLMTDYMLNKKRSVNLKTSIEIIQNQMG